MVGGAPGAEIGMTLGQLSGMAVEKVDNWIDKHDMMGEAAFQGARESEGGIDHSVARFSGETEPLIVTSNAISVPMNSDNLTDLKRWLRKPRFIESAQLSSAASFIPQRQFFSLPGVMDKLTHFSGISFTFHMRVQVNASPFDQGIFMLAHYTDQLNQRWPNAPIAAGDYTGLIVQYQYMPNVFLNLADQTAVELSIPFYYPYRYLHVSGLDFRSDTGGFTWTAVTPPVINSGVATYRVMAWLEDVELFFPTTNVPISLAEKEYARQADQNYITTAMNNLKPQGPEFKAHHKGTTSVVVRRDNIDEIQSVPAYAKPYAVNTVSCSPPDKRFDSFQDFFRQWGFLGRGEFEIGASSKLLMACIVRPQNYPVLWQKIAALASTRAAQATRLAMATEFFDYWSGSIEYKINFAKTKFHSGRIRVCFVPHAQIPTINIANGMMDEIMDDCWNETFDLRENTEITFSVPYTSANYASTRGASLGTIFMRVENSFVAPDTVSPTISFMVWSRGGPDFRAIKPVYVPGANRGVSGYPYFSNDGEVPLPPPVDLTLQPQGPLADTTIKAPDDFVNEAGCSISRYLEVGTPWAHKIRTSHIFPASPTTPETVFSPAFQPLTKYNVKASDPINLSAHTKLLSAFIGYHSDLYDHDLHADQIFLTDFLGYSPSIQDQTRITIPYLSNLRYNIFDGSDVVNNPPGAQGCLYNFQGFYPWYPILVREVPPPLPELGIDYLNRRALPKDSSLPPLSN